MSQPASGRYGTILTHIWTNLATQIGGSLESTHQLMRAAMGRRRDAIQRDRAAALKMLRSEKGDSSLEIAQTGAHHDASNLLRALDNPRGMTWATLMKAVKHCGFSKVTVTVTCTRVSSTGRTQTISAEVNAQLAEYPEGDHDE